MGLELLLPLMIIALVVMMFMQGSRQRKALKTLHEMQNSLTTGDRVLTTSGLHATVVGTTEETLDLEIAPGVRTRWDRRVIRERLTEAPAAGRADSADSTGPRDESTPE